MPTKHPIRVMRGAWLATPVLFLLLTLVCSGCGLFRSETVPSPSPCDKPLQFSFPHGQQGQMLLWRNTIIRAMSWTRGDGVSFYRIGKNGVAQTPVYESGIISAGYVTNMCIVRNVLYITTNYSVQTIVMPEDGRKPYLLENMLLSFPSGGVDKIVSANGKMYITAGPEIREYDITPSGRLRFSRVFLHGTKNVTAMRSLGDTIYIVRRPENKTQPWIVEIRNLKNGTEKKIEISAEINNVLTTKNGVFLSSGRRLMDLTGKDVPFPENRKPLSFSQLQNGAIGVIYEQKDRVCRFAMFDGKEWTEVPCGPVTPHYRFLCDGNYLGQWTGNCLKCNNLQKIEKDGFHSIPVIYTEAPVIHVPPYVFSIDCSGGEYRLYGFDARYAKPLGSPFDVDVTWSPKDTHHFRYDLVLPPFDLQLHGKWLFAPEAILDVSDPECPKVASRMDGVASCVRFDEKRQLAFFAQDSKLSVKSIRNLPKLTVVAEIPAKKDEVPQWTSFDIDRSFLFANTRKEIITYDVSDIQNPVKLSTLPLKGGTFYKVLIHGKYLYAFPYSGDKAQPGILIVDISNPRAPKIVHEMTEYRSRCVIGAKIYGDKLYIANGIFIKRYSLEQPDNPRLEGAWTGPDSAMQSYNYTDVGDGVIVGKKYPRWDVWRIEK